MSAFFTKRTLTILISLLLLILVGYFILPVSVPLLVALFTAMFLEPLVRFFEKIFKRNMAVMIVFFMFVATIGLSGYFITTKVITEAVNLVENAPSYINELQVVWYESQERLDSASENLPPEIVTEISNQVDNILRDLRGFVTDLFNIKNIQSTITNIPNMLVSFLVYLIALFLFMYDLPRITRNAYSLLKESTATKVKFMSDRLSTVIFGFFKAQFLVSIVIFVVAFIGLLFITPEHAFLMAFIIWLIDLIPIIGSIVILGPWALFHLITGDITLGTKLAALAILLIIIRRTLEPKVMSTQIGLSPLATLITMFLGLKLLGMTGLIVGPLLLIAFNSARESGIIKWDFKL